MSIFIADNVDELEKVVFAKGFGKVTDIMVDLDGYLYVPSASRAVGKPSPNKVLKHRCKSR